MSTKNSASHMPPFVPYNYPFPSSSSFLSSSLKSPFSSLMADSHRRTSAPVSRHPQQPSRLQRRAPASLQINRSDWKVAIPLLSPLVSPSSPKDIQNWKPDSREASSTSSHHHHHKESEPEKPQVSKKWQHPAAPFHYDCV